MKSSVWSSLTIALLLAAVLAVCVSGKPAILSADTANSVAEPSEPLAVATKEEELPTTTINLPTVSEQANADIPTFNRNQVSLDLPGDLFSSTANLTLRLRNFIADFITRTSVRIAQVVRFFQPLFGYHLMIDIPKELDV